MLEYARDSISPLGPNPEVRAHDGIRINRTANSSPLVNNSFFRTFLLPTTSHNKMPSAEEIRQKIMAAREAAKKQEEAMIQEMEAAEAEERRAEAERREAERREAEKKAEEERKAEAERKAAEKQRLADEAESARVRLELTEYERNLSVMSPEDINDLNAKMAAVAKRQAEETAAPVAGRSTAGTRACWYCYSHGLTCQWR